MNLNKFFPFLAGCLLVVFTVGLNSCSDSEELPVVEAPETPTIVSPYQTDIDGSISLRTDCDGDEIHWEYEGPEGPDHWGGLCGHWACDGTQQSPVNLKSWVKRKKSKSLYFYWDNSTTHIVNNGHTIQFNYDQPADIATNPNQGSYLTLNGAKYHLLQFHFHTASEHTVNGEYFPMEIHFVHQNQETGELAVIGVMVEEGDDDHPFFENFAQYMPEDEGSYVDASTSFNAEMLMPEFYNHWLKQHFWWYEGSLTTPPCSEIVHWFVMNDPISASHDQLHAMEEILHENYRPVQPLNNRLVKAQ